MKEPRGVGDPPQSSGEFIQAHPQSCFVCYGQNSPYQHDHQICSTHKPETEAYKKAHGSEKRASAHVWEANVEVSKDDLSNLMMIGTKLAKEIQEIKRAWGPKPDKDKDRDKDKRGKGWWRKKEDAVNKVAAEEDTLTIDAP